MSTFDKVMPGRV